MYKILFLSVFFFFHFTLSAQFAHIQWSDGQVLLDNGTKLEGKIKFESTIQNVLYTRNKKVIQAFHISQLQAFSYYDSILNLKRSFGTYFNTLSRKQQFFEILLTGQYHLLKKIKLKSFDMAYHAQGQGSRNPVYYVWDGRKLVLVRDFKTQLKHLFHKHEINLNEWVKKYDLSINQFKNQVLLIHHLNSLLAEQEYETSSYDR